MYSFMPIWGNCLPLFILGENIIKGPVDNVITKNIECLRLLLDDKYLEYIKTTEFTQSERPVGFEGDSPIAYDTPVVRIVHNDPTTEKYIERTQERCDNLRKFLMRVREDKDCYFLYSLNNFDVNRKTHTLRGNTFITNLKYFKELGLLDKIVFVGSHGKDWSDFWAKDLTPIIEKYNLKYIEVWGVKSWRKSSKEDLIKLHNQFMGEFKKIILPQKASSKKHKKSIYNIWQELE